MAETERQRFSFEITNGFGPEGLALATKTFERFLARVVHLYEQEPRERLPLSAWKVRAAMNQVVV
jgi:hypothetical protein